MVKSNNSANVLSEQLSAATVRDVMAENVLTAYEGWSIRKLIQFFLKHNISGAPVVASDEGMVGVVTQTDVLRFNSVKPDESSIQKVIEHYCGPNRHSAHEAEIRKIRDKALDYMTVNSIMTDKVITISPEASLSDAYRLIIDKDVHRVFVLENNMLVGVVTTMDILKSFNAR